MQGDLSPETGADWFSLCRRFGLFREDTAQDRYPLDSQSIHEKLFVETLFQRSGLATYLPGSEEG